MDKAFSCKINKMSNVTILELTGFLNESVNLPKIENCQILRVKLSGVSNINSAGMRAWCMWIGTVPSTIEIILEGCPYMLLKSFSLLRGVLTSQTRIESVFIPFYSDNDDEEKMALLEIGRHIFPNGQMVLPVVHGSRGQILTLDKNAVSYLAGIPVQTLKRAGTN